MSLRPSVTFVAAFLDLNEDRSKDKSAERCFGLFKRLIDSGINICVFVSKSYYEIISNLCKDRPNVYLMESIELSDLWTYQTTKSVRDVSLPDEKLSHHDTYNFLILMNSKIEFVSKAMEVNPFDTTHFSWIDFSICHVIQNDMSLRRLYTFSRSALKDSMLLFPACWSRIYADRYIDSLYSKVFWRFCGGFFIGDKQSLQQFNDSYRKYYKVFLEERKRLVWEVNFWFWLEKNGHIIPETYVANHNDSIIQIPGTYLKTVAALTTIPPRFERVKNTIRSLINQVDQVYLSVSRYYGRFGETAPPDFSQEEFKGKVTVVQSLDYGPATKYVGSLKHIPDNYWVLFCDDDQIYAPNLIKQMTDSINLIGAYQNCFHYVRNGSGGIIHGYVGNMFYKGLLNNLLKFQLPPCGRFVDDQWMSIYCFFNNIPIMPTPINTYQDTFAVLSNGYEQVGEAALAELGNRDEKVAQLAEHFKVVFIKGGAIQNKGV
jgi:hypothetical protein